MQFVAFSMLTSTLFLAAMGILQYQTLQGRLFFIVYASCFIYLFVIVLVFIVVYGTDCMLI